ncbi:hypothetical protein H6F76_22360 [Leptolyngbya sp. FACHB-321]|uniref:hypothetical protein n=1 Tax=Leptolyngbya sp. FACHB-321 TaxID=2692807 RepID=UPI001685FB20|nr:hypothetical protein [Leptolyngbya sp. FACHB-321]MBD2037703.1 hypothetical protein [Leptolyngbya sp. FACHB-321]
MAAEDAKHNPDLTCCAFECPLGSAPRLSLGRLALNRQQRLSQPVVGSRGLAAIQVKMDH